jgi:N-methylhydantoinase B
VTEGVAIVVVDGVRSFACARCGQVLGRGTDGYRPGCHELDTPMESISELFLSPSAETGEDLVLRAFVCPGCATVLDTQLSRPSDGPYLDVSLGG